MECEGLPTLSFYPLLLYTVSGDALGTLNADLSTCCPLNDPLSVESAGRCRVAFPAILSLKNKINKAAHDAAN